MYFRKLGIPEGFPVEGLLFQCLSVPLLLELLCPEPSPPGVSVRLCPTRGGHLGQGS